MASYDLVERLNDTFRQIELELQTLQQALSSCRLLAARVFELPAVSKDAEHDPLANIPVVQHSGKAALAYENLTREVLSLGKQIKRHRADPVR